MAQGNVRNTPLQSLSKILECPVVWIGLIVAATVTAYIPALRAGWIWDDNYYVTDNIHLRTWHGLRELWLRPGAVPQYYPMTLSTFWIEYHIWGLKALGYHVDNLLLHIANAVLVGLILRRLKVPGYALAAAIFALHPVQVESVAWVTERKNVLSGFFYLSAAWVALDVWGIDASVGWVYSPTDSPTGRTDGGRVHPPYRYLLCLGLYVLAILSKSVTASLPVVILLLIWWKRGRATWRNVASVIPFLACGMAMGSVTSWMEKHVVGAMGSDWNWSFPQRVLIAGRAIWFYLCKLVWPHPLIFIYPKWNLNEPSLWQWLLPAAVIAGLVLLLSAHRKIGRGPAVAGLFFVLTLFPALGFVNVYPMRFSFVADHFQYLACIAPIALAAAGLARLASRAPIGLACLLALGFLKLGMMTWNTSGDYHDAMTLWNSVVSKDEHSVIGHCDLGIILVNQGYRQEGIDELRQAVSLDPRCVEAWIGLGQAAEDVGHFDAAEMLFSVATQNVPESPLPPWQLGLLHKRLKQYSAAMVEFATAANGLPNPAPAYEMIGEIELIRNHLDAAAAQFNRSIQYDPDRVDAHNNLAAVDLAENSTPSSVAAEAQCRASLAIDPRDTTALNDLGIALARQGRTDEAADCFEQTLKIDPGFAMARENLRKLGR